MWCVVWFLIGLMAGVVATLWAIHLWIFSRMKETNHG